MEELLSTTNSIAGAKNACKQAALNRTNSEMWHGENNTFSRVCLQACIHAIQHLFSSILWDGLPANCLCGLKCFNVGSFQLLQTRMLVLPDNLAPGRGQKTL